MKTALPLAQAYSAVVNAPSERERLKAILQLKDALDDFETDTIEVAFPDRCDKLAAWVEWLVEEGLS
jgi:hypothetical protein